MTSGQTVYFNMPKFSRLDPVITAWSSFCDSLPHERSRILIDFSPVIWFDLPVLLFVNSAMRAMRDHHEVRIRLPDRPLDFLTSANYFDSLRACLNRDYDDIFEFDQVDRVRSAVDRPTRYDQVDIPGFGRKGVRQPKGFTEIKSWAPPAYPIDEELAVRLAREFDEPHVREVLRDLLGKLGDSTGEYVFLEMILNATEHPQAGLLQTTTWIQHYGTPNAELWICAWDDGNAITTTLREALVDGGKRPGRFQVAEDFEVRVRDQGGQSSHTVFTAADVERLDVGAEPTALLTAALFPGVSRRRTTAIHPSSAPSGYGLFNLVRHVTGVMGGELFILTDDLFMKLLPSTPGTGGPLAHVRRMSPRCQTRGNLLAARMTPPTSAGGVY
ncbi:MAG: hypothetical protein AAGA37_13775 [Actinomycetota bacterium]